MEQAGDPAAGRGSRPAEHQRAARSPAARSGGASALPSQLLPRRQRRGLAAGDSLKGSEQGCREAEQRHAGREHPVTRGAEGMSPNGVEGKVGRLPDQGAAEHQGCPADHPLYLPVRGEPCALRPAPRSADPLSRTSAGWLISPARPAAAAGAARLPRTSARASHRTVGVEGIHDQAGDLGEVDRVRHHAARRPQAR